MAFLTGWTYRKQITIAGQTGAGTDYQVKLLIGESSGATGEDFDVAGHSALFPTGKNVSGDLRFTASDGTTLLPFWVESVSGTTPNRLATVWVKVSADLGSNQNIYCYYGGTTTNVSSGDNTFLFFDDFDGASLDTGKWTVSDSGSGSRALSGSVVSQTANSGGSLSMAPIYTVNGRVAVEFLAKANEARRSLETELFIKDGSNIACNIFYEVPGFHGYAVDSLISGSWQGITLMESYTTAANNWRIFRIDNRGATSVANIYNSARSLIYSKSYSIDVGTTPTLGGIGARYIDSQAINWIDWYFIRKFQATEPAYNTSGSEESGAVTSNPLLAFNF
jgi:hypothetical protein